MQQALNAKNLKEGQNKFLAIEVNGHGFGIPIDSVREIVYYSSINPLPQAPGYVRGVALIRQETIPILDLNILLGGEEQTPIHQESCFIVLQLADASGKLTKLCLLADRILQTYKIDSDVVDTPPLIDNEEVVNYVLGVARVAEQLFVLIDPACLITPLLDNVKPYVTYNGSANASDVPELATNNVASLTEYSKKSNNKYLSVFIDNNEYAFPLSLVSQVIDLSSLTDYVDEDLPAVLYGAATFMNKPLGIIRLSNLIAQTQNEQTTDNIEPATEQRSDQDVTREVIVLIEYNRGLLGIMVDRIGHTYDNAGDLQQNSFCNDLDRNRIKSLGFIDKEDGSIEVIDPTSVLTSKEQLAVESWMSCIDRMIYMAEQKTASAESVQEEENQFAQFAGSYLVVQIGDEFVALNNTDVEEVLTYAELIPLKSGPEWFAGLLDLRQQTYPVIDLHIKLDVAPSANSQDDRKVLVMIKFAEQKVGLLVKKIIHSTHITLNQLQGTERASLVVKPAALHAVAELDNKLVHIINLQHVIKKEDISARSLLNELEQQNEQRDVETSSL